MEKFFKWKGRNSFFLGFFIAFLLTDLAAVSTGHYSKTVVIVAFAIDIFGILISLHRLMKERENK